MPQTILIVEDNDDDFECTYDAFHATENFFNPIQRARNGKEALDYLYSRGEFTDKGKYPRPGMLLLDLNMPGIDGETVLNILRRDADFKSLPIIVFSTSEDSFDIERCYQLGANSYVSKPTTLEGLIKSMQMIRDYWFEISLLPKN